MKPISTEVVPRPTPLGPTGLFGWLTTFARNTFFSSWPDEERDDLLREVVDICVPMRTGRTPTRARGFWAPMTPRKANQAGWSCTPACGARRSLPSRNMLQRT